MRKDKAIAITLRRKGKSYNEILKKLGVAKGTLSGWLRGQKYSDAVTLQNIKSSRAIWAASIISYNKKRAKEAVERQVRIQEQAKNEIKQITHDQLRDIGTSLYWAEGYKRSRWNITFCNTEEGMIRLIMRYFLEVCEIPLFRIRGQVQVHASETVDQAKRYWSSVSGIPLAQFRNSLYQIPRSSKRRVVRKLEFGTFRIIINDVVTVSRIHGWIEGIKKQY